MKWIALAVLVLLILVIALPFKNQSETIQARMNFLTRVASLINRKK